MDGAWCCDVKGLAPSRWHVPGRLHASLSRSGVSRPSSFPAVVGRRRSFGCLASRPWSRLGSAQRCTPVRSGPDFSVRTTPCVRTTAVPAGWRRANKERVGAKRATYAMKPRGIDGCPLHPIAVGQHPCWPLGGKAPQTPLGAAAQLAPCVLGAPISPACIPDVAS